MLIPRFRDVSVPVWLLYQLGSVHVIVNETLNTFTRRTNITVLATNTHLPQINKMSSILHTRTVSFSFSFSFSMPVVFVTTIDRA